MLLIMISVSMYNCHYKVIIYFNLFTLLKRSNLNSKYLEKGFSIVQMSVIQTLRTNCQYDGIGILAFRSLLGHERRRFLDRFSALIKEV